MYKVLVLCDSGISANRFIELIKNEITKRELPCQLKSGSISNFYELGKEMNMVLLSPQVRFNATKVKQKLNQAKVGVINSNDFGSLRVDSVMRFIEEGISSNKEEER